MRQIHFDKIQRHGLLLFFMVTFFVTTFSKEYVIHYKLLNYDTLDHFYFQVNDTIVFEDTLGVNKSGKFSVNIEEPGKMIFCANDDYRHIKRCFLDLRNASVIIEKNKLTVDIPNSKLNDAYNISLIIQDSFRTTVERPIENLLPKNPNMIISDSILSVIDSLEIELDKIIFKRLHYKSYIVLHRMCLDALHYIKHRQMLIEDFNKLHPSLKKYREYDEIKRLLYKVEDVIAPPLFKIE
ncbi:MAG TPA: hypothetical protein PLF48_01295 [Chitinophagales bacterium]|nr:hypothetical protein [Chitinophagales bacterium]